MKSRSTFQRIIIGLILITAIISMLYTDSALASSDLVRLKVWKNKAPTLDGNLEENPWRDTSPKSIIFSNKTSLDTFTLSLKIFHSENRTLHIAVVFPFIFTKPLIFSVVTKSNSSEPFWLEADKLSTNLDVKEFILDNTSLTVFDMKTIEEGNETILVEHEINELQGAFQNSSDVFSLEVTIPDTSRSSMTDCPSSLFGCSGDVECFFAISYGNSSVFNQTEALFEAISNDNYFIILHRMHLKNAIALGFGLPISIIAAGNIGIVIYFSKKNEKIITED